ncbi:MAG: tRNA lysidine(34) synthetase TilS [Gammaproteobacteria bacterium]|nr:tRNA lysidine(34) synthetase TilS [Gammaproteobacteria bacterium]
MGITPPRASEQPPPADAFLERLLGALNHLPPTRRWWVAYSGGRDSTVLLHTLAGLRPLLPADLELRAVHVDHGLSRHSGEWARHCEAACAVLGIPCQTLRVNAKPQPGESPEAAARQARYRAIAALIEPADGLLTAHHQDDQAETLLLQLLRGAGPHGLAAMPAHVPFSKGFIARPLLGFARDELAAYAAQHSLSWIEDPSNSDTGFNRNHLRHAVMPRLTERWPACAATLSRAAGHAAEAAVLLDALADGDLQTMRSSRPDTLAVTPLLQLSAARARNALRRWFKKLDLPAPWTSHLDRIQTDVLRAAEDSMPCVRWPGAEVRRYRDILYAMRPLPPHDPGAVLQWDMAQPLTLPDGSLLTARTVIGGGLKTSLCHAQPVTVRFRQGGERCRPAGRGHTHELKKLFQERGIPPWQRERIPLIFVGDQLAAVVGLWICEPFQAEGGEEGIVVEWNDPYPRPITV